MCCIEENKKRDFERLYEQEQWEKLKMLLTENLLSPQTAS